MCLYLYYFYHHNIIIDVVDNSVKGSYTNAWY